MNNTCAQKTPLPEQVVQQAIAWRICLESGNAQSADMAEYRRWRLADPMHELAWQRIENMEAAFAGVSKKNGRIAHMTLKKTDHDIQSMSRRQALKRIAGTTLGLASVSWLADKQGAWQYLNADHATTNQRQLFTLADNSQLWLNHNSTVELNFNAHNRYIHLTRGEMQFIASAKTQPVQVALQHGTLLCDSKQFFVRNEADHALVQVMQGSVKLAQANGLFTNQAIKAGELYKITVNSMQQLDNHIFDYSSWTAGLLSVRNMSINSFLAELSRYHRGFVKIAPSLNDYLVSGVFQLNDTHLILKTVARSARASVHYRTRWWAEIRS
ncbi:FecR domain-containing protein [Pseudoalteromonas rhizosphaerae]|uniref:FecR domain-containing protein n=1 Tax=Pseudoalteromonas rhizosphaerae TaxID=2518973 RepID=UPI00384BEFCD